MSGNSSKFVAVVDSRNRKVPGVVKRGERFYGRLWVEGKAGKMTSRLFPLMTPAGIPVRGVAEAREAVEVLKHGRRSRTLPAAGSGKVPSLAGWVAEYLGSSIRLSKKAGSLNAERLALERWVREMGAVRIDLIDGRAMHGYIEGRRAGTVTDKHGKAMEAAGPRTVNLDLVALRMCLKAAVDAGRLGRAPVLKALWEPPAEEKRLMSPQELERLIAGAAGGRYGLQAQHYLRFLAASGCREMEALGVRWSGVDFERKVVMIGEAGTAKNRRVRRIEFNGPLGKLLGEMKKESGAVSEWLFPSPRRGKVDRPAKGFRWWLNLAREKAGMPWAGFHHLRHFFASRAVMSGIDFMTVASWLGHRDGGVLVGKVYGHLCDEHKRRAAGKMRFI